MRVCVWSTQGSFTSTAVQNSTTARAEPSVSTGDAFVPLGTQGCLLATIRNASKETVNMCIGHEFYGLFIPGRDHGRDRTPSLCMFAVVISQLRPTSSRTGLAI